MYSFAFEITGWGAIWRPLPTKPSRCWWGGGSSPWLFWQRTSLLGWGRGSFPETVCVGLLFWHRSSCNTGPGWCQQVDVVCWTSSSVGSVSYALPRNSSPGHEAYWWHTLGSWFYSRCRQSGLLCAGPVLVRQSSWLGWDPTQWMHSPGSDVPWPCMHQLSPQACTPLCFFSGNPGSCGPLCRWRLCVCPMTDSRSRSHPGTCYFHCLQSLTM